MESPDMTVRACLPASQVSETGLKLDLPSSCDSVTRAVEAACEVARRCGASEDEEEDLMIATAEAVTNAIVHGNRGDRLKQVHIRILAAPPTIMVQIRDEGEGFDVEAVPDPCNPDNLGKPSGRGILMMKELMDRVDWSFSGKGTVASMTKLLAGKNST